MRKTAVNRVDHQPCFVLTSFPWKESSLWVEVFSRDFGRIPLVARSARKPQSVLRGVLMPFAPLEISWYGQNELRTLHTAHWQGGLPQPTGKALLSGLYANELLLKITARDDANPELFAAFFRLVQGLCQGKTHTQALRLFEWQLLTLLGYAPDIAFDHLNCPVESEQTYLVQPEQPLQKCSATHSFLGEGVTVLGQSLIDLAAGNFEHNRTRQDILNVNRLLLDFRIPQGLSSRRLLTQINPQQSERNSAGIIKMEN
jgi:DNA repair protein RecO (recombination protein O)